MKKITIGYLIVVPTLVFGLCWFFYTFNESFKTKEKSEMYITLKDEEIVSDLLLEDYIIGVIACEMPAEFHEEALKAQAVASRTYASYMMQTREEEYDIVSTIDDQCYIDIEEMKSKWQKDFQKYYNLIHDIVAKTQGIIMKKNDKIFKSFYFSMSNGFTENSQDVFKEQDIKSVNSSWDKNVKNFEVSKNYTYDELMSILGKFENISIISRNATNRVLKVSVDEKEYTGIEFRKLLSLRSTDFKITKEGDIYIVTTYGYGHGVGMSQYGANEMAKKGSSHQEILKYYYGEVEFNQIKV